MRTDSLMSFKSHTEGKNADVTIYPDRIEWRLAGRAGMSTGDKLKLGAATLGVSLVATGISGASQGSEVIPLNAISSVATEKDGIRFTRVRVICSGNTVDFRVSHNVAEPVRDLITQLVLGSHPSQLAPSPSEALPAPPPLPSQAFTSPPPTPVATSLPAPALIADELVKLAQLRDAGVLSDEEFAAQKSRLLSS